MPIETQLQSRDDNVRIFYGQSVKVLALKTLRLTLFHTPDFLFGLVSA